MAVAAGASRPDEPDDDEQGDGGRTHGVTVGPGTFTDVMRNATVVWLGALFVTAGFAAAAAYQVDFLTPVMAVLLVLLATGTLVAVRFLREPTTKRSKRIETFSGMWTLGMYLSLGPVPLLWRVWGETK